MIFWKYGVNIPITKNYFFEGELLKLQHVIFSFQISLTNSKTDHHGLYFSSTIWGCNIRLQIYNKNHAKG